MSVDQLPPGKVRAAQRDSKLVRYDEYIDTQIASTRRLVKAVDITSVLMTMVVGTLAFLLVAAVVEHWFVPGGFSLLTRTILFAALVTAVGYYAVHRLWPLLFRPINPVYAAHTIEQGSPSLKNSLLNLLLFRQQRDEITDAVYETLEQQAAQRLVRVPVEAAVDRTSLLRLGYVLVAVVALCALYKILSPKDPLITAGRVLMPWSDIVPASRVSITNIEPGSTTLARGDVLKLSAEVRGIGDDDPVVVRYTTTDGQAVDKTVELSPTAAGLRFVGQLPAASPGAPQGVAQNLRYRIEAGDARSRDFTVTVVEAPTITVERIDYDYPDYTGFADRSVTGLGDIRAIEGTEVTIHARANEPIEEATVDFEADGRHDLVMTVDETQARTPIVLGFREDRELPKFTSYVLRFTTQDGRKNRDPVKFTIDVLTDYEPEVRLTAPREKTRDVRVDEAIAIEVEARDPDFALREVRLQGDAGGSTVLDKQLLAAEHTGRYAGRYLFTPREHNLKPGDTMRYWVAARDNRSPQMSPTTSEPQTLRITAPDPNRPQPPQDRVAQRDKPQEQEQGEQGESGESGESGGASNSADGHQQQPGESASADGQSGNQQDTARAPQNDSNNNQNNGEKSEQQSGDPSENQSGEQAGEQSGQQSGEQSGEQSGNQSANGESNGDNNSGGQQGEQSNDGQSQPGNAGQRGNQNGRGAQQGSSGEQSGQQSSNSQPSNGEQQDGAANDPSGNAQRQPRDGQGQQSGERQRNAGENGESQSAEESPVSPDGDNDGEAFERIQKFLDREKQSGSQNNQQQSARDGQQSTNDANETGDSNSDTTNPGESASADGQQGEKSGADTRPGDRPQESKQPGERSNESQSSGNQQTASKGESGAGDSPQNEQGSPDSQPNMKPGEKWQQRPSGESRSPDQEPPSGGRGKRESDSQGGQGGDRAGGGEEGGGQQANREGTGSAGQNQSADEGAGESSEQGAGNNSSNAGEDATSTERTGQRGSDQRGEGSSQRDGEGDQPDGEKSGEGSASQNGGEDAPAHSGKQGANTEQGEPASAGGDPANSQTAHEQNPNQQPSDQNSPQRQGDAAQGSPTGDGSGTPQGAGPPRMTDGKAPEADAANLEYAQKQTDLVLESLNEQMRRKKVDKRLLDELGWTDDDLKKFLERWQQLKQSARGDGPAGDAARRELDDALRSLGLRPGALRQSDVPDDAVRDLQQGYRGSVPLEYQERLRAYNQGVSRARPDDE